MSQVTGSGARIAQLFVHQMENDPTQMQQVGTQMRALHQARARPISVTTSETEDIDFARLGGFTPELILYVAHKRMSDIDSQVQGAMAELEQSQTASKKLSTQLQGLRALQKHATAHGQDEHIRLDGKGTTSHPGEETINYMVVDGEELTIRQVIEKFNLEDVLTEKTHTNLVGGKSETFKMVNTNEFQEAIDLLEEEQRDLNTGNELRMVKLQSLMQQRTQILTLTTNLLQKLDEGAQAIARNLA